MEDSLITLHNMAFKQLLSVEQFTSTLSEWNTCSPSFPALSNNLHTTYDGWRVVQFNSRPYM